MHVLIVDDDIDIRETLRMFLEDEAYTVLEAGDGLAALELGQTNSSPLIMLLDFMMPRLDGMGVLRVAATDPLLTRHGYIIMTALHRTESDELHQLRNHLHINSVTKPFDLDNLSATVAAMADFLRAQADVTAEVKASQSCTSEH